MYIEPQTQFPGKTRDNSNEGKHKASATTTKPTEKKNMESTQSIPSDKKIDDMTQAEAVHSAAKVASEAARGVQEMLSWQHRAVNAAGAGLIGGAVVLGGLGVYKWMTGGDTAPATRSVKS